MKNLKPFFVFMIISLCVSKGNAQSYEFRVLANKGENTVKNSGSTDWQNIKTGSTIFSGSEIKLAQGGYLGLMHKTGKTMEVKTPNTYKVDDLSKNVLIKGSSVASQYGEFLLAKMSDTGNEDEDVSASKLNNLNVTGAVSRAAGDEEEIQLFLPKTSKVLSLEDATIKWQLHEGSEGYRLVVDNLYSETIAEEILDKNSFDLSKLDININEEGGLFIRILDMNDDEIDSNPRAIEILTGSEKEEIIKNLNRLKSEMVSDDLSLKKLILAIFYEENKLYLHAFSCYHDVIQEYPDVDFYKSAYISFIERNQGKF